MSNFFSSPRTLSFIIKMLQTSCPLYHVFEKLQLVKLRKDANFIPTNTVKNCYGLAP